MGAGGGGGAGAQMLLSLKRQSSGSFSRLQVQDSISHNLGHSRCWTAENVTPSGSPVGAPSHPTTPMGQQPRALAAPFSDSQT